MFLIGGLYMPFATTVDPDQEAIASSKSESISIKESKQSSIKKLVLLKLSNNLKIKRMLKQ